MVSDSEADLCTGELSKARQVMKHFVEAVLVFGPLNQLCTGETAVK